MHEAYTGSEHFRHAHGGLGPDVHALIRGERSLFPKHGAKVALDLLLDFALDSLLSPARSVQCVGYMITTEVEVLARLKSNRAKPV